MLMLREFLDLTDPRMVVMSGLNQARVQTIEFLAVAKFECISRLCARTVYS